MTDLDYLKLSKPQKFVHNLGQFFLNIPKKIGQGFLGIGRWILNLFKGLIGWLFLRAGSWVNNLVKD